MAKMTIPVYQPFPEGAKKMSDLPPATEAEQQERMAFFRKIVEEKQRQAVKWIDRDGKRRSVQCDLTTASQVVIVFNSLNPLNKALYMKGEPPRIIEMAWQLSK